MQTILCLLTGFVLLGVTSTEHFARSGRRVCTAAVQNRAVPYVESYVQPVYQPYLTTCQGYRLCSTYRTTYKVAYRQAFQRLSQPVYMCCPGWRRASAHAVGCSKAICRLPCQHGGSCSAPDRCTCPAGWMGKSCQTDVDECAGRSHGCSQHCVNTPGSYRCACPSGQRLSPNGKSCHALQPPPGTEVAASPALNHSGVSGETRGEIQALRSRVEALEQKLQLVLAPFHNFVPSAADDASTDPIRLLIHSLRQLDRIDSLSDQIAFLEERLETCSCKNER
uniref:EGF like domain multiple 7 n=1 Tax=Pelodiscus sinensis TaxID=13735 RepID=K7FT59_PELSI|nr:epidermal growth factor-like protein 7 [Pelodiscus sinensis]XP_014427846.1 epidermal growth factor-like protein 7 [Pelodiscus sinensis]|eukprot:XP_006120821.1 epidermal growth factor-like protein 7 [Pelodiscus sinensis]